MSFNERQNWVYLTVTIIAYGVYLSIILGRADAVPLVEVPYARPMLWTILGAVIATIVLTIVVIIGATIATAIKSTVVETIARKVVTKIKSDAKGDLRGNLKDYIENYLDEDNEDEIKEDLEQNIERQISLPKEIDRSDERDVSISRHGDTIGYTVFSVSILGALVMTAIEYPHFWIANAIYLAFYLSAIIGTVVKLVAYRRGFAQW